MTLEQAIEMLKTEYERAINLDFVFNPIAYALYQVWKEADRKRGRPKKMTDNEITKALECHANSDLTSCTECPLLNIQDCCYLLSKEAVDLINRQKAEIEKLQADYYSMQSTLAKMSMGVEQAKAEAIKEFAERLHDLIHSDWQKIHQQIDDLVKEMVGEPDV